MRDFLGTKMENAEAERRFQDATRRLLRLIPPRLLQEMLVQDTCELEEDFLGFMEPYDAVSRFLPEKYEVIDFGCYMAAQSFFFQNHRRYVGVDVYDEKLQRFSTKNSFMISGKIQEVLNWFPTSSYAICSAVPDFDAVELVKERFPNHCITYPGKTDDIAGVRAEEIQKFLRRVG